ncbi:MAG: serine/threonine-protein kinase [Deltaproteobacteria bacterium]|nr:serine/threonine-protein kinase [Deltaproteobacteria bacterium]
MREATLDDFETGPVLGQGGMATVYRSTDKRTGEVVALKLMLANVADDPTFIERFRREARATMALQHENICRVLAAGEGDGKLFMAMEVIDGGSVRELKQKFGGKFPPQLAAEIVGQLLEALGAAHKLGVIHRDLKPANLMLTRSGVLKLVDFGIAKTSTDNTLTATGMLVGTPAYMSPEQVKGDPLDGRSDLFSTGLIFHDLMCGRSPYYSDNPGTSLMKVLQEEVPGVFDVMFGVDAVVEVVHGRLTAKEKEDRFKDAAAAAAALKPYLDRVRARNPTLVADCLRNPAGMKQLLSREQADAELQRARGLIQRCGPVHAAALALENAMHLDPSLDDARIELEAISPALGFHAEIIDDPRITEAMQQLKKAPSNAGVLKRLADLHKATGNLRESAKFMKRYLRFKDDAAALQQLVILLHGPGSDPALVTGTIGKLRTQDIMAGVKTGGMQGIRPEPSLKERTQAGLKNLDADKRAAIADAARATPTDQVRRNVGPTMSSDARDLAAMTETDFGTFARLREQLGLWWWVIVAGVVAVVVVFIASKLVIGGVDIAQKGLTKHVQGEAIAEENTVFNLQKTKLNEARAALEKGSFVACGVAASQALEGEKTAKLVLDAYFMIAQCSLMGNDVSSAKSALQDFKDNANMSDPRFEIAKTQLKAIERGETPPAVRKW